MIPPKRKPRTDSAFNRAEKYVETMVLVVLEATGGNVNGGSGWDEDEDEEVDWWSSSFTALLVWNLRSAGAVGNWWESGFDVLKFSRREEGDRHRKLGGKIET